MAIIIPFTGQVELMEPAVTGTRNVLDACLKTQVKKVVVVSSIGAIALNPNWPKGQVMNEDCWSDLAFCKAIKVLTRLLATAPYVQ